MNVDRYSLPNLAFLSFLLAAALLYIFLLPSSSSTNSLLAIRPKSSDDPDSQSYNVITFPIDELELALRRASLPNKTVIIIVLNKAYAEPTVESETTMLDLFLESFWVGEDTMPLLDHILLVAADQTAYDRCMFKRLNCYKMETEGVDFGGEKLYMSQDFIKMMWRRTLLLLDVLKHGYSFIFTVEKTTPRVVSPLEKGNWSRNFHGSPFKESNAQQYWKSRLSQRHSRSSD